MCIRDRSTLLNLKFSFNGKIEVECDVSMESFDLKLETEHAVVVKFKDDIIDYFKEGFKETLFIGVENEKFLIDNSTGRRINYKQTLDVLNFLKTFGWTEVKEKENLIGLSHNGKSITLEPGNQIELAGGLCKNIHEVCLESYNFRIN